ncbi:hypothetical protein GGI12_000366, partial [Dipsacomyces acuminosporus]
YITQPPQQPSASGQLQGGPVGQQFAYHQQQQQQQVPYQQQQRIQHPPQSVPSLSSYSTPGTIPVQVNSAPNVPQASYQQQQLQVPQQYSAAPPPAIYQQPTQQGYSYQYASQPQVAPQAASGIAYGGPQDPLRQQHPAVVAGSAQQVAQQHPLQAQVLQQPAFHAQPGYIQQQLPPAPPPQQPHQPHQPQQQQQQQYLHGYGGNYGGSLMD